MKKKKFPVLWGTCRPTNICPFFLAWYSTYSISTCERHQTISPSAFFFSTVEIRFFILQPELPWFFGGGTNTDKHTHTYVVFRRLPRAIGMMLVAVNRAAWKRRQNVKQMSPSHLHMCVHFQGAIPNTGCSNSIHCITFRCHWDSVKRRLDKYYLPRRHYIKYILYVHVTCLNK